LNAKAVLGEDKIHSGNSLISDFFLNQKTEQMHNVKHVIFRGAEATCTRGVHGNGLGTGFSWESDGNWK